MATTAAGRTGTDLGTRTPTRLATETKMAPKTTEFFAYLAMTAGVLIAGLVTKAGDGHDDRLNAHDTWLYVSLLTVGYMLARGLAKSGSRDPYYAGGTNHELTDGRH